MKLITIRSQILSVVNLWREAYPKGYTDSSGDKHGIYASLCELDLNTASAEDLENIIGNTSWAEPQICDECGERHEETVQLGEDPDYESTTVLVCKKCLKKALKLR